MIRLRYATFFLGISFSALIGWLLYSYFFDTTKPVLSLIALEHNRYYSGDIECGVSSSKKGEISLWLDDKLLTDKFFIAANDTHPFLISTKTINNGSHKIKAEIVDSKYSRNKSTLECTFYVDKVPLQAVLMQQDDSYKVLQGRTLHIQFQVNKEIERAFVSVLSQDYECFPESKNSLIYETFVPIECEQAPNEYLFSVTIYDKVGNKFLIENKFQVVTFPFKKTTMAVSEAKMKEEEELGPDNKKFEAAVERIIANSPKEKIWKGAFCAPLDVAKVTCDYGTIRTTQRKGRYAHKALDIVNMPGCVVWAPQDGIVVMKERFAYQGNTVILDHGWGIISLFCHLEDFANIKVGDRIAQGNPLGTMGKTGYATGYHLHWEMRVKGVQVDPMQWTKSTF